MTLTVIVPVLNEAAAIRGTLTALLEQNYPRDQFEVIVADGGSTDATVPIIRELQGTYANLRLLYNPRRWSSAARNLGVRHMRGEAAVIVDGHCRVPDRDYLTNVARAFAESGAETLGRPQPQGTLQPTPFQRAVSIARASRLGHNPDSDIYNDQAKFVQPQSTAIAYKREVFDRVGLFDEAFDACEDVEFNTRVHAAGFRCYFSPALTIVYHPRANWLGLARQLMRYGTGRARLARKDRGSLTLPALVPPLWLAWLVVGALAAAILPLAGWLYFGTLALYAAVLLGGSLWLARREPFAVMRRVPAALAGIHLGFGWGFLREAAQIELSRTRRPPPP